MYAICLFVFVCADAEVGVYSIRHTTKHKTTQHTQHARTHTDRQQTTHKNTPYLTTTSWSPMIFFIESGEARATSKGTISTYSRPRTSLSASDWSSVAVRVCCVCVFMSACVCCECEWAWECEWVCVCVGPW